MYIRYYPENQTEIDEAIANGAEQWMLDALKGNYSYLGWGNGEDYMCDKNGGWNSPMEEKTVEGLVEQDDLNEVAHGYLFVHRESRKCTACDCTGYNPETRVLSERWYHDPRFYGKCEVCGGDGRVHVEDEAHLGLQLWILHPRKGASRGMVIKDVTEDDLPLIRAYFRKAIERTIARMGGIAGM